jgi:hypothetical protein
LIRHGREQVELRPRSLAGDQPPLLLQLCAHALSSRISSAV